MAEGNFKTKFEELTGNPHFPWQAALYERFVSGADSIPTRCDIPTGLGKTSVIAIWLLAREKNPSLPRRLVYVVNRRTVVDQTTDEVERYQKLRPELAVSTLRGQFADNREWSADPSRVAVICGTVDMIGSRLLFSGYGVGFKGKPLHAGFLGQDSLIVHDEAHLEPAFQDLLVAIEKEQSRGRFPDRHPLQVMELSATSRRKQDESKAESVLKLQSADFEHKVVKQRIHANKTLVLHAIGDEKKQLADKLAELTIAHKDSGRAILVFVRTVDDLGKVVGKLPKERTRQLTGTMRGWERDQLIDDPIFKRFLPKPETGDTTVYLVCTSAGEVGVNISADHLVCDLSTFESMAQRFGRVNRFGERPDTRIDVVHPAAFDDPKKLVSSDKDLISSLQKTLALLELLGGNGSPAALGNLDPHARVDAFAPIPTILPTSDILFDAWTMTSIYDKLPGRPRVEPYLHGIADWEPAQTKIAWRTEVAEVTGDLLDEYPPGELLEVYPLKPHELLADRSDRVFKTLQAIEKLSPEADIPIWIVDEDDKVKVTTLTRIVDGDKEDIEGTTLLLPPRAGGLDALGFLSATAKYDEQIRYDVADEWADKTSAMRLRLWSKPDENEPRTPKGMKPVRQIVFTAPNADEDAEPTKTWHWFVRITAAEADARSREPYDLQPHLDDAKDAATHFVDRLTLDDELRRVVILACEFHDIGKDRERWQRGIGNHLYPTTKWAKSGKRTNRLERSSYRHEFGSTLDVQARPEFLALSDNGKDLLLHLIAAHHGRARPHFTADESFDDNYPGATEELAIETPRRFARLQRKYGRWGLAYLESLVRAADYAASKKAEEEPK